MSCTLYASDYKGVIYSVDCATGSLHQAINISKQLKDFGLGELRDIACHGGTMWGISQDTLIRINTKTGEVVVIGDTKFEGVVALAVASTGIIYGGTGKGKFFWIDPTTGEGHYISSMDEFTGDLAFDCNDVLYASLRKDDMLVRIDVEDGSVEPIGPIKFKGVTGLSFYCCHLYGVTAEGYVLTINTFSGEGTAIGSDKVKFSGMTTCCYNCGCGC